MSACGDLETEREALNEILAHSIERYEKLRARISLERQGNSREKTELLKKIAMISQKLDVYGILPRFKDDSIEQEKKFESEENLSGELDDVIQDLQSMNRPESVGSHSFNDESDIKYEDLALFDDESLSRLVERRIYHNELKKLEQKKQELTKKLRKTDLIENQTKNIIKNTKNISNNKKNISKKISNSLTRSTVSNSNRHLQTTGNLPIRFTNRTKEANTNLYSVKSAPGKLQYNTKLLNQKNNDESIKNINKNNIKINMTTKIKEKKKLNSTFNNK